MYISNEAVEYRDARFLRLASLRAAWFEPGMIQIRPVSILFERDYDFGSIPNSFTVPTCRGL